MMRVPSPARRARVVASRGAPLVALLLAGVLAAPLRAEPIVPDDLDCVVEPSATVDLGLPIAGTLAETRFDRGDEVSVGETMARLESRLEAVGVAIATEVAESDTAVELREATSALGERTRARNLRLADSAAVSEQTLDQVSTEARIAALQLRQEREARVLAALELERAEALLARREIRSPIDGVVVERYREVGEHVDAEPVYRVARLDPLHVEVIVPIEYRESVARGLGASVRLAVPGFENRALAATVERIDAVADAASATFGVSLVLDNPEHAIPGGVRCRVDFLAS